MYYELGTMVGITNYASPFVKHEKGINIPSNDVVGEIVCIHHTTLSYTVRLSKKFALVFGEDDIYGLPGWMSDKRYMFHRMLGSIASDIHPFYHVKEFEDYVSRAEEKQSLMYFPEKANHSKEEIKKMINKAFGVPKFEYKKIIFSGPCTIILWKDGTKTIAKASDKDTFDPEKGVAICFMKKVLGHTETNKILRKASEQYEEYIAENRPSSSFDEFIDFCKDYFKSETKPEEVKKVEEDQDDN